MGLRCECHRVPECDCPEHGIPPVRGRKHDVPTPKTVDEVYVDPVEFARKHSKPTTPDQTDESLDQAYKKGLEDAAKICDTEAAIGVKVNRPSARLLARKIREAARG